MNDQINSNNNEIKNKLIITGKIAVRHMTGLLALRRLADRSAIG
jgi:hypothetical protein